MKTESREIQDDKLAAIGIGAMIVFIALILVAAVAAAVIIQTAERLQQNAQTTGEDTSRNLAGKLLVRAGFVSTGGPTGAPGTFLPGEAYALYVRLAPGSSPVTINQISYQFMCDLGVVEGGFSNAAQGVIAPMQTGVAMPPTQQLQPGDPYVLWMDAQLVGLIDCSPDNTGIGGVPDTTIRLYLHVGTGGSTYEVLTIGSTAAGSEVI
ncbi:MAG: flagellin FlaB [Candidatus Poseidoniaceae archaeon]